MEHLIEETAIWLWPIVMLVVAAALGWLGAFIVVRISKGVLRRTLGEPGEILAQMAGRPFLAVGALFGVQIVTPHLALAPDPLVLVQRVTVLAMIAAVAWLLIRLAHAVQEIVQRRYRMDVRDNLEARRINTQVVVLQRASTVVILIVSASVMLMTFPNLQRLGTSVLASAGVAGLVIGFAARPVLSNLIAGVQLALAQPIRLDDVVIVEGEWGRIEEIRATYVVVRIWDERRLIVPLSHFVEQPFQNWTRTRADILGTVFVFVDYTVAVEDVRQELHRILQTTPLWDGRAWALQVTDLTEQTMQLRALMSAADAGNAFELRCIVRERLVQFIREKYPQSLPRVRALVQNGEAAERPNEVPDNLTT